MLRMNISNKYKITNRDNQKRPELILRGIKEATPKKADEKNTPTR